MAMATACLRLLWFTDLPEIVWTLEATDGTCYVCANRALEELTTHERMCRRSATIIPPTSHACHCCHADICYEPKELSIINKLPPSPANLAFLIARSAFWPGGSICRGNTHPTRIGLQSTLRHTPHFLGTNNEEPSRIRSHTTCLPIACRLCSHSKQGPRKLARCAGHVANRGELPQSHAHVPRAGELYNHRLVPALACRRPGRSGLQVHSGHSGTMLSAVYLLVKSNPVLVRFEAPPIADRAILRLQIQTQYFGSCVIFPRVLSGSWLRLFKDKNDSDRKGCV